LVQILLQLKGAGLVASVRGAAGGYRLVKPPQEISLATVMSVIDGQETLTSSASVTSPAVAVLLETWRQIADAEREMLESTTLADLAERAKRHREPMYYI
jgi:Rrf2 family protein